MDFVQTIKKLFDKHPFACLLVLNVLFMALAVILLPFSYEGNDDRFLSWNTSGHLMGTYRYHVVWMHVFYAWFESQLYMMCPQVEWKTWLFLAIHLVSLTIMCYCVIKTNHNRWAKGMILVMLYVWEMYDLIHFQFTTTAVLAAMAGVLLIVTKRNYLCGVFLFLLGVLVRYHSAMFCGLMTAVLYPLVLNRFGFDRKQLVSLVICVVGAFILNWMDVYSYNKDSKLKEMRNYDVLRAKMYDNSNSWRVYEYPPEGLTRQEILGTTQPIPYISDSVWNHRKDYSEEYEFISDEKMELFLQTVENYTKYKGISGLKKIKNISIQFPKFSMLFAIGLLVIVGCFVGCGSRKGRVSLVFAAVCFVLINAYLTLDGVINVRAFLCGLFPLMWLSLYLVPYKKNITNLFASAALLLTVLFFVNAINAMPAEKPSKTYKKQMELVKYGINHNGKFLYSWHLILPETGYPFCLRLLGLAKTNPYTITSVSKQVLEEGSCMTLVRKDSSKEEVESVKRQFVKFLGVFVEAEELCSNEDFVLFRLKNDTNTMFQDPKQ